MYEHIDVLSAYVWLTKYATIYLLDCAEINLNEYRSYGHQLSTVYDIYKSKFKII